MRIAALSWCPLLLATLALGGCAMIHRDLYPSGQVRREGQIQGHDQVGEWTYWYESGRVRAKGSYAHDVQDGFWTWWHDNGNKEMEGLFRDERREGLWRYFHRDGNPRAQGFFARGRENGPWTFWKNDGQLAQQGEYSDGRPALRWVQWRGNGQKEAVGCWLDGRRVGTWDFWDASGKRYQKSFALPAGVTLVRETWDDGTTLRREGFLRDGRPIGRWTTWHRNGRRRASGDFARGMPEGTWMTWEPGGELIAVGLVKDGRPTGEWRIWARGLESSWHADEIAPPALLSGWSPDDAASSQSPEQVAMTWIAEAGSEIEETSTSVAAAGEPGAPALSAPPSDLERVAESTAEVPVKDQPYTKREEDEYDKYVEGYGLKPKPSSSATSGGRYGRPRSSGSVSKGDEARAGAIVDKPLPVTEFRCSDGRTLRLDQLRGKKVLMVVLRGYGAGVCVYCDAQTRALSSGEVARSLADASCEVLLVYPGPENGWNAFLAKYQRAGSDAPPFPCLFDPDLKLVRQLSIEGNQAMPSSLVLDGDGVVRFAYVGTTIDDRPSAKRLLEELRKLAYRRKVGK